MIRIAILAFALSLPASRLPAQGVPAPSTQLKSANEKVRCRSSVETGSLVQRSRVCRTVAEWRRLDGRNQDDINGLMDRSRSVPCGECFAPPPIGK